MPLPPNRPRLRLHKYTTDWNLKICHRALYDRVKQDFGHIKSVLRVLGRCESGKLQRLGDLVSLVPTGMRLTAVERDGDGADFHLRIKQACASPNSLINELRHFYTLECDYARNAADHPSSLRTLKRTVSR